MQIRLRERTYFSCGTSQAFINFYKEFAGKLVEVDTEHLFNNQYNTVNYIDSNGVMQSGCRIMDGDVTEVIDDVRAGKGKCKYCGKMVTEGEGCSKSVECIIHGVKWFTPENTFFLKYPKGLPADYQKSMKCKLGTYTLETTDEYLKIYNMKKTIRFKYDGKKFFVYQGESGYKEQKYLDIPLSLKPKLLSCIRTLTK